jgi:hypothetical protein
MRSPVGRDERYGLRDEGTAMGISTLIHRSGQD